MGRNATSDDASGQLILGPFCGMPACQFIDAAVEVFARITSYLATHSSCLTSVRIHRYKECDYLPLDSQNTGEVPLGVLYLACHVRGGFDDETGWKR
jgi:putative methionine-R-sulfoxide reductase with GAF domain